jgi:hypothetical protein
MARNIRHRCIVYENAPSVHLPVIVAAAAEHLAGNYRCLYLNSPPMIAGMRAQLTAAGVNAQEAVERGALLLSSDSTHLVDGEFDPSQMLKTLSDAVARAQADGYAGLWASGDMLWEFGSEKNLSKLLAYELGLEALFKTQPALSGICQYHRDMLPADAVQVALYTHETVYVNETLARINLHYLQPATLAPQPDSATLLAKICEILNGLRDGATLVKHKD